MLVFDRAAMLATSKQRLQPRCQVGVEYCRRQLRANDLFSTVLFYIAQL
jgi:hypothetical protein